MIVHAARVTDVLLYTQNGHYNNMEISGLALTGSSAALTKKNGLEPEENSNSYHERRFTIRYIGPETTHP